MIVLHPTDVIALTVSVGTAVVEATYADRNGATFSEASQRSSVTGGPTTVVNAPSAGVRMVRNLYVRSGSAATVTLTVDGQTFRTISMLAGQTLDLLENASLYQPVDPELTAIAGLTTAADKLAYWTGSATAALTDLTAYGRSLIGATDLAAALTTLGLAGLATTAISGTLTLTKTGTTASTATFPDAAITVAGSAAALTSGRVPFVTTDGLLADEAGYEYNASTNVLSVATIAVTGSGTSTFAGIVNATDAIRIDRAAGNPYLAFRRATVTAGYIRCTAADTIAIESSAAAAICTFAPTGITAAQSVTVPNGTADAPGIRTTTYAHGLFSQASASLGFAAAGVEVGRADATVGWSFFNATDNAGSVTNANRIITTPGASSIHNGINCTYADNNTGSLAYYSSAYRGILNIIGNGSNSGYDRGLTFEAYHRGNGTRSALTGAFIEVGTYNSESDSTGTITDLIGIKLQALKTSSSTITTGVLLDLGAGVGTMKYAIRSTSGSGIVSIGDATDATTTSDGSVRLSGGFSVAKSVICAGSAGMFVDIKNSTGALKVNSTKVVGAQGAAVADATDAASVILRLNDLLARCRAHGLIAT